MTLEYEAMLRGERPIVKGEQLYLGNGRESGISNNENQERKNKHIFNKKYPFILPGLGKKPQVCGKPKLFGIGVNFDAVGWQSLKCGRIDCPSCYPDWLFERVKKLAFMIEAYSMVHGDRFSHVVTEKIGASHDAKTWDLEDYDNFHKRSNRHLRSVITEELAGYRAFHSYKIHKEVKEELNKIGYGIAGNGHWKGVRENVLCYEFYEDYYYLSPHDHNLVYGSFLNSHSDNQFFLKKVNVMDTLEAVIGTLFYIMSHVGVFKDEEAIDNHPAVPIGLMKNFHPENFLSATEIKDLEDRIDEIMHAESGKKDDMEEEKDDNTHLFHPMWMFSIRDEFSRDFVDSMFDTCPSRYKEFWQDLIDKYNQKMSDKTLKKLDKDILISDIVIPDGISLIEVISTGKNKVPFYSKSDIIKDMLEGG